MFYFIACTKKEEKETKACDILMILDEIIAI